MVVFITSAGYWGDVNVTLSYNFIYTPYLTANAAIAKTTFGSTVSRTVTLASNDFAAGAHVAGVGGLSRP